MEELNRYRNDQKRIELWMGLSLLLYVTIECMSTTSLKVYISYLLRHMDVFLINYLLVLIVTAPCLLFRKMLFVFNILSVTLIGLTCASRVMLVIRGLPLRWADFFILKDGLTIANKYISMPLVILIGTLILGVILFLIKTYTCHLEIHYPKIIRIFVVVIVFVNILVIGEVAQADIIAANIDEIWVEASETLVTTDEALTLDELKTKFEKLGQLSEKVTLVDKMTQIEKENQEKEAVNYEGEGFLYSFLASYESQKNYVPEDYNAEHLKRIKAALESERVGQQLAESCKPNIIFLQLESFIDPYSLKGVSYNQDPVPCMRPYMEGNAGGILKMPDINTARTEFEILTGIRIADLFPVEVPYTSSKLDDRGIESVAQLLRQEGYYTTAMHNNNGAFYERSENYNKLGFDKFIPLEGMEGVVYQGDWPKDAIFLPYIQKTLSETPERDFIFAVTVGTHSSYHYDYTSEHSKVKVSGQIGKAACHQVQDYVDRLYETDQMVGELIEFVKMQEELIVLVVYGDHIPTMDVITMDTNYPKYEVPFFVVSNEKVPEGIVPKEGVKPAYTLYPSLLEAYGLPNGIIGSGQKVFKDVVDYEEKMNLIAYDLILGKGYLTGGNTLYTPTQLIVEGIN